MYLEFFIKLLGGGTAIGLTLKFAIEILFFVINFLMELINKYT